MAKSIIAPNQAIGSVAVPSPIVGSEYRVPNVDSIVDQYVAEYHIGAFDALSFTLGLMDLPAMFARALVVDMPGEDKDKYGPYSFTRAFDISSRYLGGLSDQLTDGKSEDLDNILDTYSPWYILNDMRETLNAVYSAIDAMPPEVREMYTLYYGEEANVKQFFDKVGDSSWGADVILNMENGILSMQKSDSTATMVGGHIAGIATDLMSEMILDPLTFLSSAKHVSKVGKAGSWTKRLLGSMYDGVLKAPGGTSDDIIKKSMNWIDEIPNIAGDFFSKNKRMLLYSGAGTAAGALAGSIIGDEDKDIGTAIGAAVGAGAGLLLGKIYPAAMQTNLKRKMWFLKKSNSSLNQLFEFLQKDEVISDIKRYRDEFGIIMNRLDLDSSAWADALTPIYIKELQGVKNGSIAKADTTIFRKIYDSVYNNISPSQMDTFNALHNGAGKEAAQKGLMSGLGDYNWDDLGGLVRKMILDKTPGDINMLARTTSEIILTQALDIDPNLLDIKSFISSKFGTGKELTDLSVFEYIRETLHTHELHDLWNAAEKGGLISSDVFKSAMDDYMGGFERYLSKTLSDIFAEYIINNVDKNGKSSAIKTVVNTVRRSLNDVKSNTIWKSIEDNLKLDNTYDTLMKQNIIGEDFQSAINLIIDSIPNDELDGYAINLINNVKFKDAPKKLKSLIADLDPLDEKSVKEFLRSEELRKFVNSNHELFKRASDSIYNIVSSKSVDTHKLYNQMSRNLVVDDVKSIAAPRYGSLSHYEIDMLKGSEQKLFYHSDDINKTIDIASHSKDTKVLSNINEYKLIKSGNKYEMYVLRTPETQAQQDLVEKGGRLYKKYVLDESNMNRLDKWAQRRQFKQVSNIINNELNPSSIESMASSLYNNLLKPVSWFYKSLILFNGAHFPRYLLRNALDDSYRVHTMLGAEVTTKWFGRMASNIVDSIQNGKKSTIDKLNKYASLDLGVSWGADVADYKNRDSFFSFIGKAFDSIVGNSGTVGNKLARSAALSGGLGSVGFGIGYALDPNDGSSNKWYGAALGASFGVIPLTKHFVTFMDRIQRISLHEVMFDKIINDKSRLRNIFLSDPMRKAFKKSAGKTLSLDDFYKTVGEGYVSESAKQFKKLYKDGTYKLSEITAANVKHPITSDFYNEILNEVNISVREGLYDGSSAALSGVEEVANDLMLFYSFQKYNLLWNINAMIRQPMRYKNTHRVFDSITSDIFGFDQISEDKNLPEWIRESSVYRNYRIYKDPMKYFNDTVLPEEALVGEPTTVIRRHEFNGWGFGYEDFFRNLAEIIPSIKTNDTPAAIFVNALSGFGGVIANSLNPPAQTLQLLGTLKDKSFTIDDRYAKRTLYTSHELAAMAQDVLDIVNEIGGTAYMVEAGLTTTGRVKYKMPAWVPAILYKVPGFSDLNRILDRRYGIGETSIAEKVLRTTVASTQEL